MITIKRKKTFWIKCNFISLFIIFLLTASLSWGRAGGAGGGHSSGHGHRSSGGGGSHFGGGYRSTGSGYYGGGVSDPASAVIIFFIVVGLVIFIFVLRRPGSGEKKFSQISFEGLDLTQKANPAAPVGPDWLEEVKEKFKQKVRMAFFQVQESWSEKSLKKMRRFISDGVYQRFNAQFLMMNILDQRNPISDLQIFKIEIVDYQMVGAYEIADVKITASASDQFISDKFPQLISVGGTETFVEYWSFLKRKTATDHDIYNSEACPQCSAPLTQQLMETARCPYCGVYINSGEFDWVLAEITQAGDYQPRSLSLEKVETKELIRMSEQDSLLIPQIIEDRASYLWMQLLMAISQRQSAVLQRFCTELGYQQVQNCMIDHDLAFNRLYLNSVELVSCKIEETMVRVQVNIRYSSQKILLVHQGPRVHADLIDSDVVTNQVVVELVHQVNLQNSMQKEKKGSIYALSCPHCGSAQTDSLNVQCTYCGGSLNDPKQDWILNQIFLADRAEPEIDSAR